MRRELDMQADRIEAVLASHKVTGRVAGGMVTSRYTRFDLVTPLGTRVSRVSALAEEIALALGARSTRIFREGDTIQIAPRASSVKATPSRLKWRVKPDLRRSIWCRCVGGFPTFHRSPRCWASTRNRRRYCCGCLRRT